MDILLNSQTHSVNLLKAGAMIDGVLMEADLLKLDDSTFHIISDNHSYRAEVIELNAEEKTCRLKVNGTIYQLAIKDQYSELLTRLGIDTSASQRILELKAPMPGMVLNVFVNEGTEVKKDDSLLTLEAMKMENILKSPADGIVKSIKVTLGNKVEKNQVLITFE